MKELASGNSWTISETEEGYLLLELKSIYGTVETKAKGVREYRMFHDILITYDDLKAQGPVVVESQVE